MANENSPQTLYLSQILTDSWMNKNDFINQEYIKKVSEDPYLSISLNLLSLNENLFNFDINFIEQALKRMNFDIDPSILEITRLLSTYSSGMSTISYYFLYFNSCLSKFEEAEKYLTSSIYMRDKGIIENSVKTFYDQMKKEKDNIAKDIGNEDKINEVRKTFLKQSLSDVDSKFGALIDMEKKRLEPKYLSIITNSDQFLLELRRKKKILEFCRDYFQIRQDNFKENINTLKKHITVYEIGMKSSLS